MIPRSRAGKIGLSHRASRLVAPGPKWGVGVASTLETTALQPVASAASLFQVANDPLCCMKCTWAINSRVVPPNCLTADPLNCLKLRKHDGKELNHGGSWDPPSPTADCHPPAIQLLLGPTFEFSFVSSNQ